MRRKQHLGGDADDDGRLGLEVGHGVVQQLQRAQRKPILRISVSNTSLSGVVSICNLRGQRGNTARGMGLFGRVDEHGHASSSENNSD